MQGGREAVYLQKSNILRSLTLIQLMIGCAQNEAHAVRITPHTNAAPACAVLENFTGEVQILDSTRSRLLDTYAKAPIPCGSWVSVITGVASITHREGFKVKLAANSFLEVPEPATASTGAGDHFMLFRGQAYAISGDGSKELRMSTANGRARMSRGRFIMVYNHSEEETQLIALANKSSLENRFENSRRITAKAGEASTLNFKYLRVVPSAPRALSEAAMKVKMDEFSFDDRERVYAIKVVRLRQERKLAIELDSDPESVKAARIRDSSSGQNILIQAGSAARADLAIAEREASANEDFPENFDPMKVKFPDDSAQFRQPAQEKSHAPGSPHAPKESRKKTAKELAEEYKRSKERPEDAPLKSRWHRKVAGGAVAAQSLLFPENVDWDSGPVQEVKKGPTPLSKKGSSREEETHG